MLLALPLTTEKTISTIGLFSRQAVGYHIPNKSNGTPLGPIPLLENRDLSNHFPLPKGKASKCSLGRALPERVSYGFKPLKLGRKRDLSLSSQIIRRRSLATTGQLPTAIPCSITMASWCRATVGHTCQGMPKMASPTSKSLAWAVSTTRCSSLWIR